MRTDVTHLPLCHIGFLVEICYKFNCSCHLILVAELCEHVVISPVSYSIYDSFV